jgi:inhibitor of cysteine peptidase
MKKILPFIWFIAILPMVLSACNSQRTITLTKADNNSQVEVSKGGVITIELESNPSTGYAWEVQEIDPTKLEQVGDPIFTNSNPGLIGSGGILIFKFTCLEKGNTVIKLVYQRPWESNIPPIDTFSINISIK